jgi:hypothetical protein
MAAAVRTDGQRIDLFLERRCGNLLAGHIEAEIDDLDRPQASSAWFKARTEAS